MKANFYKAPNGQKENMQITNIYPEDEEFFTKYDITISMEELGDQYVVYADTGYENEDGYPEEFIALAEGRNCEDVLKELRELCENFLKENEHV